MSLEEFSSPESAESGSNSTEVSEKYKEAAKKAAAWISRTQKDEGKAKKYDFLLAKFLVDMILQKKYDDLLQDLFLCLDAWYGANFLLGILSLAYSPISDEIRKFAGKDVYIMEYIPNGERLSFDTHDIPEEIRKRVNIWIEDMESVVSLEVSSIIMKRTLGLILYDEKIRNFTSRVFAFFFSECNIEISAAKSQNYSEYILWELEKTLKRNLPELQREWSDEGLEI